MGNVNQKWLLWITLLERWFSFESNNDFEHVEDDLINKRVVLDDEEYLIQTELGRWNYAPEDIDRHRLFRPTEHSTEATIHLWRLMRKISEVGRLRRANLLIRDWSKKRPWQVLRTLFGTSLILL